jgi:hypothetical protein
MLTALYKDSIMQKNYTRQRQGRDFSLLEEINCLRNAELIVEGTYNNIDGVLGNAPPKDDYEATTLLEQLEYNKAVSERNSVPVDGHEPPQERSAPERTR